MFRLDTCSIEAEGRKCLMAKFLNIYGNVHSLERIRILKVSTKRRKVFRIITFLYKEGRISIASIFFSFKVFISTCPLYLQYYIRKRSF